jgi:hypothetical protein
LDWQAGTSRGRHAADRLKGVLNEIPLKGVYPPELVVEIYILI